MKFLTYKAAEEKTRAGLLNRAETGIIDLTNLLGAGKVIKDIGQLLTDYDDPANLVKAALNQRDITTALIDLNSVHICAPILNPPTIRDACIFERHVISAGEHNGVGTPAVWYKAPIYYYQNTNNITGPGDTIYRKRGSSTLDYEAEVALVIGKRGKNILEKDADQYIFGFTIFNDWSDRARCTFEVGFLGLHHGKDAASAFGPYVVTLDEFQDLYKDGKLPLKCDVYVNDIHTTDSRTDDMHWTLPQVISYISEDTTIVPGDIVGLGTVGAGCIYERPDQFPYLRDGDIVTMTFERLGTLQQKVGFSQQ